MTYAEPIKAKRETAFIMVLQKIDALAELIVKQQVNHFQRQDHQGSRESSWASRGLRWSGSNLKSGDRDL
jgi:hypothetical protein